MDLHSVSERRQWTSTLSLSISNSYELVVDKELQSQVERKKLAMLGVKGDVEVLTSHIKTEHKVLWPDDGLQHAQILVGRLALDSWLVETAKSMHDALLVVARRSVNP